MFHSDNTFVLALIAVSLTLFFILFTKIHEEKTTKICRGFGYAVLVLAVIMLLISGYSMVKECMMKKHMMKMMHQQRRAIPAQQMQKPGMKRSGNQQPMHRQNMPMHRQGM